MAEEEKNHLTVVMLGKTGAGKSSLGNTLIRPAPKKGLKPFKEGKGLTSETRDCDYRMKEFKDLCIEVVDTPGLCDTHREEDEIYQEVAKAVALADRGPHVIIFALRCDRRFTNEEYGAYKAIQKLFSEEMNTFLILVFNGLDALIENDEDDDEDDDDEEEDEESKHDRELRKIHEAREILDDEIESFGEHLQEMVNGAKGGYFGISNKVTKWAKQHQADELLDRMIKLKQSNDGKRYSTETTKEIAEEYMCWVTHIATTYEISLKEAAAIVKQAIVDGEAEPSFMQKITSAIAITASRVMVAVSDACSVM